MSAKSRVVALRAANLMKWFGEGALRTQAVNDVSFDAYFGEVLFFVGPSGSGKTTLLSMISGILKPDGGSAQIEGTDVWSLGSDAISDFRLNKIGFVFQDYHLFPRLTTAENVAIPLILKKQDWNASIEKAEEYLDFVGLKGRAHLPPVKLSGGEQQRVAIARAMISQPDFLILDEPTASLDGETGRDIMRFLRERFLNERRCILIVTHDSRIYEFADRVMKLEDGRLTGVELGTTL